MEIASVSKQFHQQQFFLLQQENKLKVTDFAKYLGDDFPYKDVTISQLLSYRWFG
jgi:hypothetical protein